MKESEKLCRQIERQPAEWVERGRSGSNFLKPGFHCFRPFIFSLLHLGECVQRTDEGEFSLNGRQLAQAAYRAHSNTLTNQLSSKTGTNNKPTNNYYVHFALAYQINI